MPKNVEDAIRLDKYNSNYFWQDAIQKELKTVCIAYKPCEHNVEHISPDEIHNERQKHLIGYREITCHFVFDVKLDGSFTRKARFCANGSKTDVPKSLSYSSVVSHESVCIAFPVSYTHLTLPTTAIV